MYHLYPVWFCLMKFFTFYVQSDFTKIQFTVLSFSIPAIQFGSQSWYFAVWPYFESWPAEIACGLQRQGFHHLFLFPNERSLSSWQPYRHDPAQSPVQFPFVYGHIDKDLWRLHWPSTRLALTLFSAVRVKEMVLLAGRQALLPQSLHVLTLYHRNRRQ